MEVLVILQRISSVMSYNDIVMSHEGTKLRGCMLILSLFFSSCQVIVIYLLFLDLDFAIEHNRLIIRPNGNPPTDKLRYMLLYRHEGPANVSSDMLSPSYEWGHRGVLSKTGLAPAR